MTNIPGTYERAVAFVVIRLSSSRLPVKQLRKIGDRTILEWIVDNLKRCRELDEIVLATVAEPENEILREVAQRLALPLFWYEGDVNHVTTRLRLAAESHRADICLLISADCPLIHAPSLDKLIGMMRSLPEADCLTFPPLPDERHCLLDGTQIARLSAWQRADDLSDRPELKEHQFPVLYRNPQLFRQVSVVLDPSIYGHRHRLSVDTWADMEFMNTIHDRLAESGRPFQLPEVAHLLEEDPRLCLINSHVHQRELIENLCDVLFIVDAGGEYGYANFLRDRELAGQIVERLSWPVSFLVDSRRAARMCEECGFKVFWGALDRKARASSTGQQVVPPEQAASGKGLILVDATSRYRPVPGWRKKYFPYVPVVTIDPQSQSMEEADLVLVPGATGYPMATTKGKVNILQGWQYAILRREIIHQACLHKPKDIDLLVALQRSMKKSAIEDVGARFGWHTVLSRHEDPLFPELLARSKVYLSGFGPGFYEALSLGAYPMVWPTSPHDQVGAEAFYETAGLPAAFVWGMKEIETMVDSALHKGTAKTSPLEDGTPAIIRELAHFHAHWSRQGDQAIT